jgi:hypothetical protein
MKRLSLLIACLLAPGAAFAGNSTLTYTTAQSTAIQTRLIPRYNADHCARFGLGPTCTTAELVTAGCTNVVRRTVTIESCTIFAQNATGEQAFLQEVANQELVTVFNKLIATQGSAYSTAQCNIFNALSPAAKQADCTAHGLPTDCDPCP